MTSFVMGSSCGGGGDKEEEGGWRWPFHRGVHLVCRRRGRRRCIRWSCGQHCACCFCCLSSCPSPYRAARAARRYATDSH